MDASPHKPAFPSGNSHMSELIRAYDWSKTSLGPIADWPQSLRTAVDLILRSPLPLVVMWGPEGIMIYNDAQSVCAGGHHPKLLGSPVLEALPEVADFNAHALKVVFAGGTLSYRDQHIVLYRHGHPEDVWMDLTYSPILDESGRPAGVLAIVVETTERVRAIAAAAERSRTLELLNSTGAALSAELNLERLVQAVTDAGVEITGAAFGAFFYWTVNSEGEGALLYTVSGVPREEFSKFSLPRKTEVFSVTCEGQGIIRSDDITQDPRYGKNDPYFGVPEGHMPVRSYLAVPVMSRSGVLGTLVFGHPAPGVFTKAAEQVMVGLAGQAAVAVDNANLFLASQRLNATLEAEVEKRTRERDRIWNVSQDLLLVADREGRFLAVNPAWTAVLGWREVDLLGKTAEWLEHPDDRVRTREEIARLAQGHGTVRFESRFRHRNGTYRWLSWRAVPDDEQVYGVARDITADKAAQAELEAAQEALRQAQKMEAVGHLTGGIAHDFNNLLTGIAGSLDLLLVRLAQGRTGDLERYAKAAIGSANRAAALTHRLLAFARRQPLDPRSVDANALVVSMEELLRRTLGEAITLEMVTADGLWTTLCDPNQLESAILNLAINARDAMPDGGKLTIETVNVHFDSHYAAMMPDVKPGQYVAISVTDTGVGMSAEVTAQAFDPFFTTKPLGQGTGLGLSMVYGFAKQSEGHVRIYSEVGTGTTVKIYLPRHGGAVEETAATSDATVEPERSETGETVLVVEDDPVVRNLILEILHDSGYRALEAADGPAGLQILQSNRPIDLLVTDVGLPGLNGRQLADEARRSRPDLKILFITGYAENAVSASGFLEPGMEMMTKPFAIDAMALRIREMIQDQWWCAETQREIMRREASTVS